MYVEIRDGRAGVGEPDDCTSLEVRVAPGARTEVDTALRQAGLGTWNGEGEADLSVATLHALAAQGQVAPDWAERWDAMIAYAARKGWLSDDGEFVAAHLVDVS